MDIVCTFWALTSFLLAIVELNTVGIMHTNISEANMLVLRTRNAQGILVGFEFAILDPSSQNKRMLPEPSPVSQACPTDMDATCGTTPSTIPENPFDDVATHHVATLPLSRCMDRPPVHQFQHELESFVWSIFFIQGGFCRGRRLDNPTLEKWYTRTWEEVYDAKHNFLRDKEDCIKFAGRFAESLDVDPQPMQTCSQALADQLFRPNMLDAARLHSTLQEARDAYARNYLRENMANMDRNAI
jgi:hypothetical protein